MARAPTEIVVNRQGSEAARRGHPWLWRQAIVRGGGSTAAGEEVQIVAEDGVAVGRAIADPGSPIALRMWTSGRTAIDDALVRERMARAFAVRARLFADGRTTAYRLLNGEGDRCPGFVVDRYGDVAVVRVDGDGAAAQLARITPVLVDALVGVGVCTIVHRSGVKGRATEAATLHGPPPPDTQEVREHGVPFVVDLARGQKTGAFLDQRENRRRVGALAGGRRVLNLFSYAGGFSLHAALGGATRVTSVDSAASAHATAQASFRLAGVDPSKHAFATADAFAFLASAKTRGETWDLVVSDPPSFAPNEKSLARALSAYRTLHRACVDVLAPGGIFCAASCSSHVDAERFASTLDDSALGGAPLRILELHGPPADHPSTAAWAEGRYLKFAVLE
jgi:23S rRNA (cytosine1962-C5)-methyltransferase